jgi:hypothetical protein
MAKIGMAGKQERLKWKFRTTRSQNDQKAGTAKVGTSGKQERIKSEQPESRNG